MYSNHVVCCVCSLFTTIFKQIDHTNLSPAFERLSTSFLSLLEKGRKLGLTFVVHVTENCCKLINIQVAYSKSPPPLSFLAPPQFE
jgi:hypothetical protein